MNSRRRAAFRKSYPYLEHFVVNRVQAAEQEEVIALARVEIVFEERKREKERDSHKPHYVVHYTTELSIGTLVNCPAVP